VLEQGVTRAHLVPPVGGALLKELYTLDGIGTLLSRDPNPTPHPNPNPNPN
jgi:hypothetical protein